MIASYRIYYFSEIGNWILGEFEENIFPDEETGLAAIQKYQAENPLGRFRLYKHSTKIELVAESVTYANLLNSINHRSR